MKSDTLKESIRDLELGFVALYGADPRSAGFYYQKSDIGWPQFHSLSEKIIKIYLKKDLNSVDPLSHESIFPKEFLRMVRTIGLRILFGSNLFLYVSKDNAKKFSNFFKNFDDIKSLIDLNQAEVISICLKSHKKFLNIKYNKNKNVIDLRRRLFNFSDQDNFIVSSTSKDKFIFLESCKSIIENADENFMSIWYTKLRDLSGRIDACRKVISSVESVWAYSDIDGYKRSRLLILNDMPYTKRATTMAAIIMSGNADGKIVRKARSDNSFSTSLFCIKALFEYRYMYDDKFWRDLLSNLYDSRHKDVVNFLCLNVPKDLLFFLLGNNHADKDILFKRMGR